MVEEVGGAHRHQLDEHRLLPLGEPAEAAGQGGQRQHRPRVEIGRVARDDAQDGLDEAGHLDHELAVFLVRLRIAQRPAAQLADRPAVIVDAPQVVAATGRRATARGERRERSVERQDVEPVLRQAELADDLGAEQAHDIAGDREAEARHDLLGDGRATEHVAAFEHHDPASRAGQVGRGDEPVVPAPDDDRVVPAAHPDILLDTGAGRLACRLCSLHRIDALYRTLRLTRPSLHSVG